MGYTIQAEIEASETTGMYARDWFNCGINDASDTYSTEREALEAAASAYKGPDADGIGCRYWAEPTNT